ncbi:MAG: virulence factor family protein [Gammaproteobacteria bacterium]|nr:virulence factor family protein [Gammaproteobacteria bacterium]
MRILVRGIAIGCLLLSCGAAAAPAVQTLPGGRFGTLSVYLPAGTPSSVALFVSGDGGWELGVTGMARSLTELGAVAVGIDIRQYLASLRRAAARPGTPCQMIAADFETLSHDVQKRLGLRDYLVPVLVGYSSGATVVYAALAQSPPGTFAGALSLGFCPDQDFAGAELCPGAGLHYRPNAQHELVLEPSATLRQPWIALQGQKDQVCSPQTTDRFAAQVANAQVIRLPLVGHGFSVERNWLTQFRGAYRQLATRPELTPQRPADIGDLPVHEVHASGSSDEFALLLTGDGGWAGLDQELAARLAASGVPSVGLNSLKYFWSARTPEQTARDVSRILEHYLLAWHKEHVLLIGYSFGADVLPFVVNRLAPELRARIRSVSLLGIDAHATFEVHLADWIGNDGGGTPTEPEVARLAPLPVLCLYGAGEQDSICPLLPETSGVAREQVGTGHHFGGEYATLAERILAFAQKTHPTG